MTPILAPAHPITEGPSGDELARQIKELFAQGHREVILNLLGVPYMDSGGVAALVRGHTAASRCGGRFKLVAPGPRVRTLLERTRLVRVFEVYDSLDESDRT
jgi:anti-sigma B factor antagonist